MKAKTVMPGTISGFAVYIQVAYTTAMVNEVPYGINPNELAKIKDLLSNFTTLQALCTNPSTATKSSRDARNIALKALKSQWRVFLNKEIRFNDAVSVADKEIFGIFPPDDIRTPVLPPKGTGTVTVVRVGEFQFDVIVEDAVTGKKKRPDDATGSNLYSAVVEVGEPVPARSSFHFEGFSSTCHHMITFSDALVAKRAYLFARYSNQHGQEGPEGPVTAIIVN
ncbi:MAG: hypothetical protein LBP64_06225 [Tannerella sp.]|jgi:hypothetical protein|nr:hypothetical protein [Tannerella sp.]